MDELHPLPKINKEDSSQYPLTVKCMVPISANPFPCDFHLDDKELSDGSQCLTVSNCNPSTSKLILTKRQDMGSVIGG